ncbi:MAG: thioredoxin domain-containing protein [Oligoflexia bacterium]|nr:thioredoxin domain-containing protein [Oligoflexia bacterium]
MRTDTTFLKILLALSLAGILVSGWLLSTHIKFSSGQASLTEGCGIPGSSSDTGCASVAVSEYSYVMGIPVAAIAMSFYFTVLILGFWSLRNYQAANESLYVLFLLSTISILVTVLMFFISRFVLKSFCIGCAMLWLINLAIWPTLVKQLGLNWGNALFSSFEALFPKKIPMNSSRVKSSFIVSIVSFVAFSIVGATAKGMQTYQPPSGAPTLADVWKGSQQTFLPTEAYIKNQSEGAEKPVMTIVKFADFQCPACKMAAQFLKPFLLKHKDKVQLTYLNFPLDGSCNPSVPNGGHTSACYAAKASICAAKSDKFWALHDQIFDNQENLSPSTIDSLIEKIGLDLNETKACMDSTETTTTLQRQMSWGEMINLESTPTLVINGRKVIGAYSMHDLEALLKELQANAK